MYIRLLRGYFHVVNNQLHIGRFGHAFYHGWAIFSSGLLMGWLFVRYVYVGRFRALRAPPRVRGYPCHRVYANEGPI